MLHEFRPSVARGIRATTRTPPIRDALHVEACRPCSRARARMFGQSAVVPVDVGGLGQPQHQPQLLRLAGAVIGDRQGHRGGTVGQPDDRPRRVTVHGGVEQRFTGDPQQCVLDVAGSSAGVPSTRSVDPQVLGHVHGGQLFEHLRQAGAVRVPGMVERVYRRAQLLGRRPGEILGQSSRSTRSPAPTVLRPRFGTPRSAYPRTARVWATLSCSSRGDPVTFGIENLMTLRRTEFALGGQQFGVARAGRPASGLGDAVSACSGRLRWNSEQFCNATAVWLARMRITISSVPSRSRARRASTPRRRRSTRRRVRSARGRAGLDHRNRNFASRPRSMSLSRLSTASGR